MLSRLAYSGTENAYSRLSGISDWYLKVLDYYNTSGETNPMQFFRGYYQSKGITLQSSGTTGSIGLDSEFLENTIVMSTVSDGFFGLDGTAGDTLSVTPALPAELSYWRMENLMFRQVKYDLEIGKNYVILESVQGNTYGLSLKVNIKTDDTTPEVYVNGTKLDASKYTVADGVVSVTTSFSAKKIEVR